MPSRPAHRTSAGLLPFHRDATGGLHVFIGHMGGPFWASRDEGGWSIAKGEYEPGEDDPVAVALREFTEEIGVAPPTGELLDLGVHVQRSGKRVQAYAVAADPGLAFLASNSFELEWPRGSGRLVAFPEIDRAGWFPIDVARHKVVSGQVPILDALERTPAAGA
ncbi:MAG: NUDIX domain-containing protein [Candidatus Nanopelagicales bacterium]|jgi:predicted NUDIX family NTP pyrophosphohydrolase|nr:NUDIX domain-containing protein [Candidatus Nanopelagicales bacterium]